MINIFKEGAMEHLFAYGTLMCDDILTEVAGCWLSHEQGILEGYRRLAVKNEPYPALKPDASGAVSGVVYKNVPASAWARLDRFEGEMYDRLPVRVVLENGLIQAVQTYVTKPAYYAKLEHTDWYFAEFLKSEKHLFQKNYKGYDCL